MNGRYKTWVSLFRNLSKSSVKHQSFICWPGLWQYSVYLCPLRNYSRATSVNIYLNGVRWQRQQLLMLIPFSLPWQQISVGMCWEPGMHHWTRPCWLRKASVIHRVPAQFMYHTKVLIITGLCWSRERGKGLHWGKGQQGISCLRLGMLL